MTWRCLIAIGLLCAGALAMVRLDPESGKCGCCPKCCSCVCSEPTVPVCEKELELCILQDSSGSIKPEDWTVGKTFLVDVLEQFSNINNRVAHISYSNNATLNWALDSDIGKDPMKTMKAVENLDQFQAAFTNPVEALQLMMAEVFNGNDKQNVPNVCLIVTDGRANFNVNMLEDVAAAVHPSVLVVVIGVSLNVNVSELAIMASGSGDSNIFSVDDFDSLVNILTDIVVPLCLDDAAGSTGEDCFCCCPPPKPFLNYNPMGGGFYGGADGECCHGNKGY